MAKPTLKRAMSPAGPASIGVPNRFPFRGDVVFVVSGPSTPLPLYGFIRFVELLAARERMAAEPIEAYEDPAEEWLSVLVYVERAHYAVAVAVDIQEDPHRELAQDVGHLTLIREHLFKEYRTKVWMSGKGAS